MFLYNDKRFGKSAGFMHSEFGVQIITPRGGGKYGFFMVLPCKNQFCSGELWYASHICGFHL